MSMLKKYTIDFIVISALLLFYFIYTTHGQKSFYRIISYAASNKAGFDVDIKSLNLRQYPYVKADIMIEDKYDLHIHGFLSDIWSKRKYDMQYTLKSDYLESRFHYIDSKMNIDGRLKGQRKYMEISGAGELLDGNVSYDLRRERKIFKDVNLVIQDINSTKLFHILDEKVIFKGQSNANLHFDYIDKKNKKGTVVYKVQDKDFHGHVADLDINVTIDDENHSFTMALTTPDLSLKLREGKYNQEKRHAHALYTLDIKDLSAFEKELGGEYVGAFHAVGEIEHDEHIKVKGLSNSLGGMLDFDYNKTMLHLTLTDVPFSALMQRMEQTPLLEANTTGQIVYDTKKREMDAKIILHNTKVLASKLSDSIYKEFDYDIAKEIFTQSTIDASLRDGNFSSKIILANDKHHLILKDTKIEAEKKSIETYIHLKTPKHSLKGQVYARLDNYITQDIYLNFDGIVKKHYALTLDGIVNKEFINMGYTLSSQRLPSHIVTIEDNVSIQGHVNGAFSRLRIRGKGHALDGSIRFDGIKKGSHLEDITLKLENIHALKLSTLFGQPMLPSGKADVDLHFIYFGTDKQRGEIHYKLKDGLYRSIPLSIDANIDVKNHKHTFIGDIELASTKINITKGLHDAKSNRSSAFFTINSKDLSELETLLGHKYLGPLYTMGNISYKDTLEVRGLTKTYGGMIDYLYKKDMLYIDLEDVSLTRFMNLFDYPHMIKAQVNGNINYDYMKEQLLLRADLNNTRFLKSDLVHTIFKKSGINMLKEVFPQTTLFAIYQNNILAGDLILKSKQSHFYVKNMQLNTKENTVNAHFDLRMQGQAFSGKVYGSLQNPKVKLNLKKLIRYQMDKQMDSMMGKGNRELMESMPMGGTAKDMATDVGAGFMEMFF